MEYLIGSTAEERSMDRAIDLQLHLNKHIDNDEEQIRICEIKKRIHERGNAHIQIRCANGDWAEVGNSSTYNGAMGEIHKLKMRFTDCSFRVV